jgi:hypothetical protein
MSCIGHLGNAFFAKLTTGLGLLGLLANRRRRDVLPALTPN